jgi:hypothetical protein
MAGALAHAATARADTATDATVAALRDAASRLLQSRPDNPLHLPLSISSSIRAGDVRADSQGVIDAPFLDLVRALRDPEHWCAVLILHINNKACRVTTKGAVPHIALKVANRYDQPADESYEIDFVYHSLAAGATMLSARLDAANGPMGTSAFVIRLDAVPYGERRTALQLSYTYHQNAVTSLAMDLYVATLGSGKVGFTAIGLKPDGAVDFIGGVQGVAERNLMRDLLAVRAAALEPDGSTADAYTRRLRGWFDATESFPVQLHEIDRDTYLQLKLPQRPRL